MAQVIVENLTKTFRIAERSPGLWGAFKALADRKYRILTALDKISFSLEKGEIPCSADGFALKHTDDLSFRVDNAGIRATIFAIHRHLL